MASNKMLIDASHPEETRVVVLRGNRIEEFDFESQNKQQLKGNIYLAKVTRVEPSLQAAFVDYGGNRHGFLAFSEIHPDYYQIPVADRQALLDEEAADARRDDADDIDDQSDESDNSDAKQVDEDQAIVEIDSSVSDDSDETPVEAKPKRRQRRPRKKPVKSEEVAKIAEETQTDASVAVVIDDKTSETVVDVVETTSDDDNKVEKTAVKKPRAKRSTKRVRKPSSKVAEDKKADESVETNAEIANVETSENNDETADSINEDESSNSEKPTSIAAMMETDSISEPAPDDDTNEDDVENGDEPDLSEKAPAAKKRSRSTRRPRKTAKSEQQIESDDEVSKDETNNVEADAPVVEASSDVDTDSSQKEQADTAEEAQSSEVKASEDASDEEKEAAPKTKTRRRKRSTRSRKKTTKDDDDAGENVAKTSPEKNGDDDGDEVQSSGQEDALEEVPQRRRSRRQYKIQEVVKRRQVLLVQVVKEERGNKGAALTTYLSLAGRYSVLMPNTARGGGISRKITNAADRKRLKTIASELEVPEGMGVILRTAGASRTKEEIQRDFEYLMRLWENVRNLTLSSSAPCLVYEEGSLIKRSIRDLYDKNTGEVVVAGESGYNEAKSFMTMLMPSHANKVSLYQDEQAMFARFGIEQQLDKMLSQQVTLKSGGYLVIDQTEALVAIDVNSGRATREHSIEDTALQTNLETAEEVARQLRLRDLAGLIVIDFIDMEEKRNNRAVEKKLKECLKHDRARIQVGRISHFGLLEMSRQRMRASVLDSTMEVCPHCQGKGYIRSSSSVSLHLLRAIEEHLLKNSRFNLMIAAATEIAAYILNHKRSALLEIEERFGVKIFIEGRHDLLGENYNIEKGEASTGERKPVNHIQVGQISDMPVDNGNEEQEPEIQNAEESSGKRKRRRRRGRGNKDDSSVEAKQSETETETETNLEESENESGNRKRQRGRRAGRGKNRQSDDRQVNDENLEVTDQTSSVEEKSVPEENQTPVVAEQAEENVSPAKRNSRPRKPKPKAQETKVELEENGVDSETAVSENLSSLNSEEGSKSENQAEPPRAKRRTTRRRPATKSEDTAEGNDQSEQNSDIDSVAKVSDNDLTDQDEAQKKESDQVTNDELAATAEAPKEDTKKRGGWWSRNGFFK